MNQQLIPSPAQPDFFVADILDAAPRGDLASMEHPIFSISTRPDMVARTYNLGKTCMEVIPSGRGLATVHDRDVLIFAVSQLVAAADAGREPTAYLRINAHQLLLATNRGTDGRAYRALTAALERLRGTTIKANFVIGGKEITEGVGLIDGFRVVRETTDGRMSELELKLADWTLDAVRSREVLRISPDYFRLRSPLARRLYEIGRKHCGQQVRWTIGWDKLSRKVGSRAPASRFKRSVRELLAENGQDRFIPDYLIEEEGPNVIFRRIGAQEPGLIPTMLLQPEDYEEARAAAAGWDVHALEREWREWIEELEDSPRNPGKHFVAFCRAHAKRNRLD
ncbi:replication initiator protein A [Mangrovicoccus sp. HB161399]|uniref:replication initiator protein A n=1 Tax=Mangrovicoccus sp. HB161399 TaxID=2720392 RepID=UPI001557FD3E|nr:replication initiator protein A [Mangrovicoccus sp. HB161399]